MYINSILGLIKTLKIILNKLKRMEWAVRFLGECQMHYLY